MTPRERGLSNVDPDELEGDLSPEADGEESESGDVESELAAQLDAEVVTGEDESVPERELTEDERAQAADRESASAEVSDHELRREVAALLFASPEPLSEAKLSALLGGTPAGRVRAILESLGEQLRQSELPWELRSIAGGWQLYTAADLADTVGRLAKARKDEKVSPAGLETLAIVAYRQPVTKGEIEAIRGVQVGPILRTLVDRGMVKVAGRSDDPGRPLLYGTTKRFLDAFGLGSLDDLPRDGELLRD